MYRGSNKFEAAMNKLGGRTFRARLKFDDDVEITDIMNVDYRGGSNLSDNVAIGTTVAASVDIDIPDNEYDIRNKEFLLEVGIKTIDEIYEYAPMGFFVVNKVDYAGSLCKISCIDRMAKFNKIYVSNLSYPASADDIVEEICNICNVDFVEIPLNSISIPEMPQGYYCREVIGYIAAKLGKFACINREGLLVFKWYENVINKSLDIFYRCNLQNVFDIQSVTFIKDSDTRFYYGPNENSGIVNSNPLSEESDANNVYNILTNSRHYYAIGNIEMLGDIRLDAWDCVSFQYFDGAIKTIPCMTLNHTITGGCTSNISSSGKTLAESENDYEGPVIQSMKRVFAEMLAVNKLIADEAEFTHANIEKLDANDARINKLMFGSATGEKLDVEFAKAIISVLGQAWIQSAMIDTINASKINAGELNTNNVSVQSKDGNLSIQGNDIILKDDENVVRVKIGKVGTDYDFNLFDTNGKLMFSAAGISENAIKQAIIDNEAIKKGANIDAGKLDVSSLFSVINNDGTHTLNATKVYLDKEKQSLEVSLESMTESIAVQNQIPYPYATASGTYYGVEWNVLEDGSVSAKGKAGSSGSVFVMARNVNLAAGTYYIYNANEVTNTSVYLQSSSGNMDSRYDTTKIKTYDEDYVATQIRLVVSPNATVDVIFKPMLIKGKTKYPYVPYEAGHSVLPEIVKNQGTEIQAVQGKITSKVWEYDIPSYNNELGLPYYTVSPININGVEFTVLDDGRVLVNGTNTSNTRADFYLKHRSYSKYNLEAGEYILSGAPKNSGNNCYLWGNYTSATGSAVGIGSDLGDGRIFTVPEGTRAFGVYISVNAGYTADNVIFEPMIEKGNIRHKFTPNNHNIDLMYSQIEQSKDKIDMLVASDAGSSELVITEQGIEAITKQLNVKGGLQVSGDAIVGGTISATKIESYELNDESTASYKVVIDAGEIKVFDKTKSSTGQFMLAGSIVPYGFNDTILLMGNWSVLDEFGVYDYKITGCSTYTSGPYTVEKYSDGRMRMIYKKQFNANITSASGGIYWGQVDFENFPENFSSEPTVIMGASGTGPGNNCWVWGINPPTTINAGGAYIGRGTSTSNASFIIQFIAEGYWK